MIALSPLLTIALSAPSMSFVESPVEPLFEHAAEPVASPIVEPEYATLGPALFTPAALALGGDVPQMEYTYIEGNFVWTDSDDLDQDISGVELIGSLELPLNFFAQVTYSHLTNDADLDQWRIGAGYHLPITSRFDAYGILSYAHLESDGLVDDFSDDGAAAELGLRFLLTPRIELNGAGLWSDAGDSAAGIKLGARFYFIDSLSIGGRVESFDSNETFALGLRFEI
jgi:hypothetical protein